MPVGIKGLNQLTFGDMELIGGFGLLKNRNAKANYKLKALM